MDAAAPTPAKSNWQWFHTISVVVIVLIILVLATSFFVWPLTKSNPASTLVTWWIIMILLALFVFIVGHGITGKLLGALIDEQNKMSLARLQLVVWTIVILSAWMTSALWNILIGKADPLMIGFPQQIWILLGISTTTLVGTPLVLNPKKGKAPNTKELIRQLDFKARQEGNKDFLPKLNEKLNSSNQERVQAGKQQLQSINDLSPDAIAETAGLCDKGQLLANCSPDQATLGDLFQGDEVGNRFQLDMGKIQLFFFTVILVLTYAAALGAMFANLKINSSHPTDGIMMFPTLDDSMIALLGISHTGNLTNQGISHSEPPTS